MNLEELKKVLRKKRELEMEPVYNRIREKAMIGVANATFEIVDFHLAHHDRDRKNISQEEIDHLKKDGYVVTKCGKTATVSGW